MRLLRATPFFKEAYRMMSVLAEREQWSRSDITRLQLERINDVWRHAINHVPYYRTIFRQRGLPKEFRSVSEYSSSVPLLDKPTVRSSSLLSERRRPGGWHHTSGSTGIPLAIYRERDADAEMTYCQYRSRSLWGVDIFDRSVLLYGHGSYLLPGLRGRIARLKPFFGDRLRSRIRYPAYKLAKEDLVRCLREMKRFRPVFLYGYSSAIHLLALESLQSGVSVDSLKLVVLTSEPVTGDIRETVQRAFAANVVEEYGAAECHLIAYQDAGEVMRVREDLVMVETLPSEDGDYRIIISVLNNPSFPLLRYDIGDVSKAPLSQHEAGFAMLGPIVGKANDFLITRTGRRARLDEVIGFDAQMIARLPSVRRFRAHQFLDGRVQFLLESDSPNEKIDVDWIRRRLSTLLDGQMVDVTTTDSIPPIPSGKHSWIVSELAGS
jgi:phenylacetate-CoA ligase